MKQNGRDWLDGKIPPLDGFGEFKFHPKQIEFINNKSRSSLAGGGMASGKTLPFVVKVILYSQWFPGSNILIGRKTQGNAEETFMKDFVNICPSSMYEHAKGAHKILFTNGSVAEFWGLEALQSGATDDIKKAEQKLKSHNFHFEFVDQLEDIEKKVYDGLMSRMRARMCPHPRENPDGTLNVDIRKDPEGNSIYEICHVCGEYTFNQFVGTTNPANFWGYAHFKVNPAPNTFLIEMSTFDNKANLSAGYLEGELNKPELYKMKFLYGQWDDKSMVEGGVFYEEHIMNQRALVKPPRRVSGGIRIFDEPAPDEDYQIGVDPSLGATDPCSITVVSKTTGRVVATYTAKVPTKVIAEKTVQLALMYSLHSNPLVVPEATGVGQALVEALKPLYEKIYQRQVFSTRDEEKHSSKLGFYTTHATKTQLIEHFKTLLAAGFPKLQDNDHVEEMNKFIYTDTAQEKGAGAQKGYHDDRIMSALLAYWNVPPSGFVDQKAIVANKQRELLLRNRGRIAASSSK